MNHSHQNDLPPRQNHAATWTGRDLQNRPDSWTYVLSATHIDELEDALNHVIANDLALENISKDCFALPTLGAMLADIQKELVAGKGFMLIRGLDISRYTESEASRLFFGLGAHIGHARSQNAQGHLLGHVRDVGADAGDPGTRIYQTSERQTFHTDSSDVVGLLCLRMAKSGGESMLVSASSIYNRFLDECPHLLPCLFDAIATDRRGEIPKGMKPFFEIPVYTWHAGFLTIMYQRQYIDSAQRFPDAMPLTARHVEAMDMFDTFANDPEMFLSMSLEPGDMQFVHNHALLHDRTGFVDWPDTDRRRYLQRLWLSVPGDRPLPECFAQRFGTITIGDRGGIITGPWSRS